MDCPEAGELLNLRFDGTLGRKQGDGLDSHLKVCDRCRRRSESLRRVDEVLGSVILEEAPPRMTEIVMKTIKRGRAIEAVTRISAPLAAAAGIGFYLLGPALLGRARSLAEGLDRTTRSLSQAFEHWSGAIGGTGADVVERAADAPGGGTAGLIVLGIAAIVFVVYAHRVWRALALEWQHNANGAGS